MLRAAFILLFVVSEAWCQNEKNVPGPFLKQTFTYKRVSTDDIKADVYSTTVRDHQPVILWIHGGALIFGSREMLPDDERDAFLRAGYVIVAIDYRLAPTTKLPEIVRDVEDAHRWVLEKGPELFHIDPERVAIVGQSAGAYLALLLGAVGKPSPQAIVSFYGYGDITGSWYSRPSDFYLRQTRVTRAAALQAVSSQVISESAISPRDTFYLYCRQHGLWPKEVTGFDPALQLEKFHPYSPDQLVTATYPPALLLHGDADTEVPFAMSERMAAALQRQGIKYELYRMAGFNHLFDVFPEGLSAKPSAGGLSNPKVAAAFQEVLSFLSVHVGARLD